ncbi:uncharacterized protein BDW43DRAFT_39731 [Aspergillus alliaceus]|uniref:uncharacterized protein n=1 Tax=Petromyces alliaceus TaxID=209559 RepID=UPI0012A4FEFE|nr:uncharacterized protein BDW43DRAFT_39731 [Aspergillus alliaceus]KAB8235114.1 hypothetical protein BDW43DRAFT_39731 [Aspergillus alliaceus]
MGVFFETLDIRVTRLPVFHILFFIFHWLFSNNLHFITWTSDDFPLSVTASHTPLPYRSCREQPFFFGFFGLFCDCRYFFIGESLVLASTHHGECTA